MKRRLKKKKVNMKAQIILTTIGAAVLAAITLNANASDALLTPRAAGNQIKIVSAVTAAQPTFAVQTASPRALGSQTKTIATVANDVNPTTACRNMVTSPKAIQACAEHPTALMECCKPALADNLSR